MWAQIIVTILALWIMVSPYVLNFNGTTMADFNFITGPVMVTFAFIAFWDVIRPVRKVNIIIAAFLIIVTLFFDTGQAKVSNLLTCVLIIILSFFKARVTQTFGGGWKSLFRNENNS